MSLVGEGVGARPRFPKVPNVKNFNYYERIFIVKMAYVCILQCVWKLDRFKREV